MSRWLVLPVALAAVFLVTAASGAPGDGREPLEMFTAEVDAVQAGALHREGFDVVAVRTAGDTVEVDLVLSGSERAKLQSRGVTLRLKRNKDGKTQTQLAAEQSAFGFEVWRSFDEPGGLRDELYQIARNNPQITKLEVIGHSIQGREILALKVTQGARGIPDGARPAALFISLQHAREWISGEVNRRLLRYYVDGYEKDKQIKEFLKDRELWFVLVANPDGYEYTFTNERLWRKNLRDNDGDRQITNADGVDPNRNFPEHWNYDNEGSSSIFSSQTYRGAGPASEPETQAMKGLFDRLRPKLMVNWHSAADEILYPVGWQVGTLSADDPIYTALAGTDANPAIAGFDPGPSADELYVTNGNTNDYAQNAVGSITFTPELGEGCAGCGFVFPDDEALIEAHFQQTLPFAKDVAASATDPDDPASHIGISTEPFYLKLNEVDPEKTGLAMADLTFDKSYGDPQVVEVLAKRSLGAVTLKYQVNGGPVQSKPTAEWAGGEKYGQEGSTYYHFVRGHVTGTSPGDTIKVWFEAGGQTSDSFTYAAVSESGAPVLIMAAEDYSGASTFAPGYPAGPRPFYLSRYTNALAANRVAHDVYDVDANGRTAPDHLGVLSHFDAVIWYTGNDTVTREPGWGAGNASRLAIEELYEVRAFLNEGGKLLYTGKLAGHQYTTAHGTQLYDPFENRQCRTDPAIEARCRALFGSPASDGVQDVLQYWFGTYLLNDNAGTTGSACNLATGANCTLFGVNGIDNPFDSLSWAFNGADSAQNQNHSASFITTSGILPASTHPQFTSWVAAKYDRPGGPFDPHSGDHYVYSQISDVSYKRLTRTIDVPATGGTLSFWTSFNTEDHWDFLFVEAHTPGQDDWTTLPDLNGHTSQDTGESCKPENGPGGWRTLHPHLDHYQTHVGETACAPNGTTGAWHAASGSSNGWQQWTVDLSAYAGKQVEISIAYASDWALQGLGVFIDDITLPDGTSTSFEAGLDGWAATGPPPGSAPNPNNFMRTTSTGFPEGAVVATEDTLFFGFGFEGISDAARRNAVMARALDHLLP